MRRLEGKVALITGGAGGQGAAEARLFAKEGAAVVITDLNDETGKALAEEISKGGGRALYVHHDVTDEAGWIAAVDEAKKAFGGLNILVNNAGTISRQSIQTTERTAWDRTMAVNLTGPVLGMKIAAPLIRDSGGGSIINISSAAGLLPHNDAAYTASKWGLRGVTKTAAVELVEWNIRVNSVHPGQVEDTGFFQKARGGHADSGRLSTPMQRPGTPNECAEVVLFLASDQSSYVTGAEIAVDGGMSSGSMLWLRNKISRQQLVPASSG